MIYLVSVIVVLGVLIFVHELGHFLAARAMGVAVIRFSFGLGPKTPLAVKRGETEYCLSWIPFGGYVKMAGHDEEGPSANLEGGIDPEVAAIPVERRFESKSRLARAFIFSAGVAMNALFAVLVYGFMAWYYGVPRDTSVVVGDVRSDSLPIGAGPVATLRPGDRIVSINDDSMTGWADIEMALLTAEATPIRIRVAGRDAPVLVDVPLSRQRERQAVIEALVPAHEAVLGQLVPGEPAHRAGLLPGDRIIRAGGDTVRSWETFVPIVEAHPDRPLVVAFVRGGGGGAIDSVTVTPRAVPAPHRATVDSTTDSAGFARVRPGYVGKIGASVHFEVRRYGPLGSLGQGLRRTVEAAGLVVFTVKGLILGRLSPRDIGGPILIGQLSGQAAQLGVRYFLDFLALFSVNLAVLNLLPIPVLDGGHLMFLLVEAVRRRPLSVESRQRWMTVGLVVVLLLMVLALYNDVMRLFQ